MTTKRVNEEPAASASQVATTDESTTHGQAAPVGHHHAVEVQPAQPDRDPDADLPVVARLVVEIRSDGSRTIARGALEDVTLGQRVAVQARGDSPLALALALARSLGSLPRLSARAAVRGLLARRSSK